MIDERTTTTEQAAGAGDAGGSTPGGGVWAVRPHGDIDIERAGMLAAEFDNVIDRGARVVVVDLSQATFLDSSGLRVIVRAGERLRARNGQLLLEGASGAVARVLEVTGLLEHYAGLTGRP